jgi:hypothetical protein
MKERSFENSPVKKEWPLLKKIVTAVSLMLIRLLKFTTFNLKPKVLKRN